MVLIYIQLVSGEQRAIDVDLSKSVAQLKQQVATVTGFPASGQRLIFAGRVLKDDQTLLDSNIQKECSIHLHASVSGRAIQRAEQIRHEEQKVDRSVEVAVGNHGSPAHHLGGGVSVSVNGAAGAGGGGGGAGVGPSDDDDDRLGEVSPALKFGDIITVNLIEARNLIKADFWTRSSDPYVIFALGKHSAKSKIVKRNLNPIFNESFGFIWDGSGDQDGILSIIMFDFDNFTPDDFIGSAEINVSELKRNQLIDKWMPLENVKHGEIHIQIRRSILTSPSLHEIVSHLMALERSWTSEDLKKYGVTLEQLMGDAAWKGNGAINPALKHLADALRAGRVDWRPSSLSRIEKILRSQNMLMDEGVPSRHLWFSGLPSSFSQKEFVSALNKQAAFKTIRFPIGCCCAMIDYRNIGDALLAFLAMQFKEFGDRQIRIGFGRRLERGEPLLSECRRAGFLSVSGPQSIGWQHCWCFLTHEAMHIYQHPSSSEPLVVVGLKETLVCSQGPKSLELYVSSTQESWFLRTTSSEELGEWKAVIKRSKDGRLPVSSPSASPSGSPFPSPSAAAGASTKSELVREQKEVEEDLAMASCGICKKSFSVEQLFVRDLADESACLSCLRNDVLAHVAARQCAKLNASYSLQDLKDLLSYAEFELYLDASLRELLDSSNNYVKCPSCQMAVEFVQGDRRDAPNFAREMGLDNKPLDASAQRHYLQNRIRCRNDKCSANFCRSCHAVPYHGGFTCDDYVVFKNADHCRFCMAALMPKNIAKEPPSAALSKVCSDPECIAKRDKSCLKTHACGHPCGGVRNEKHCMPCLLDSCRPPDVSQGPDDFCSVCFTDGLAEAPAIQLDCGHIYHYDCMKQKLAGRWPGAQITFGFCACPLCKVRVSHPLLLDELKPIRALHKDIELKSLQRLEFEGLDNDSAITDLTAEFYHNPVGFAVKRFAYYMCFKCKNPYFGGQARCNNGLESFDPSELICGACSGIGVEECPKHGKDYIQFKCKFCCGVGAWFCWGRVHFCNNCHQRQEAHDYMTTRTRDQLAKCPGPEKCPLKVKHPPNGEEFSLGCAMCQGGKLNF